MSATNGSRDVRDRLVGALRRELMGPSAPDETLKEFPTTRYIIGRLAPARASDDDDDAAVDPTEDDTLGIGSDGDEDGSDDAPVSLIMGFNPSSIGLSSLIAAEATELVATVSWGDYRWERDADGKSIWQRYRRAASVTGIPAGTTGAIPRITLSPGAATNPPGVIVTGVDDTEICLEGVVHEFAGYRAVSLFVVSRRTKGALGDRTKDERWIFQSELRVSVADGGAVFLAKNEGEHAHGDDGEGAINGLLFRHAREFASGHGVAATWAEPSVDGKRTSAVSTEYIPTFEVPQLIAPSEHTGAASLRSTARSRWRCFMDRSRVERSAPTATLTSSSWQTTSLWKRSTEGLLRQRRDFAER